MTETDGNLTYNVAGAYTTARATYDPESDALDIELVPHWHARGRIVAFSRPLADGIVADFDRAGHVVGVEILGVTRLPRPDSGDDGRDREGDTGGH